MTIEISDWMPAPAATPEMPLFAIGDVHGCADELIALHGAISRIAEEEADHRPALVHLGDLIDRGPASLRVLDTVAAGLPGFTQFDLMANHEQLLMQFLFSEDEDPVGLAYLWLRNGGQSVLAEVGLDHMTAADAIAIRSAMLDILAGPRIDLLRRLVSHVRFERYLFVHAGVAPDRPLSETFGDGWDRLPETPEDECRSPLWVRQGFLTWDEAFPDNVIVIHGHTITKKGVPEIRANRIGIDTGAYRGRALTAIELRDGRMRFIQSV